MERLKKQLYGVGAVLAVFGITIAVLPKPKFEPKTEKWLESKAPMKVAGFTFDPSPGNPMQSYRMDQSTYDILKPYGIVARVFHKGRENYDTVIIAGKDGHSFHNPRVCFTGSGYEVQVAHTVLVPTQTRGLVPMSIARLSGKPGAESIAAYCYKTPLGFCATTFEIRRDLILSKLLQKPDMHGVFYRFIPGEDSLDEAQLIKFAGEFLDSARDSSSGYF